MIEDSHVIRIKRMLWALIGLGIVIPVVVNLFLGWGVINQQEQKDRLLAQEQDFNNNVSNVNEKIRTGIFEIERLLETSERIEPVKGIIAIRGLEETFHKLPVNDDERRHQLKVSLIEKANHLLEILFKSADWRGRNDRIFDDIDNDITLNKVREQLTKIQVVINDVIGKLRLEMVLSLKKYERDNQNSLQKHDVDRIVGEHKKLLSRNVGNLLTELADMQRLVEVLAGEKNYDRISDLRDNRVVPNLERLERAVRSIDLGEKVNRDLESELTVLKAILLGQEKNNTQAGVLTGTGVESLYAIVKKSLKLQQENKELRAELNRQVLQLDQDWNAFTKITEQWNETFVLKSNKNLSKTWITVSLISLWGGLVFLIVIWLIFKAVSKQVEALGALRRRAEAASQSKDNFLASMSHELRTPLNAIIGFSDMMKMQAFGPLGNDKYLEYSQDIQRSGAHLLDIINDILDVSAIESGTFKINEEEFILSTAVNEALHMVQLQAKEQNVGLENVATSTHLVVFADERLIRQIILNLLVNAVKFTPKGGTICISDKLMQDGEYRLDITDTGVGMDEEGVETALTPFGMIRSAYNDNTKGTGLGLPLAKRMMEMHNGTIEIVSEPGQGTSVTLIFPSERVRG
ncbi:sensor histidine kinase [Kiloniella litopenaei]|uniref:sensor histidine kinase n=1 Tax=Kiloniella litopenaei TaxID=1549748 RepID=UPI0009E57D51|nr:HAMP domain-containing sensor histidine kinase [Kiloniella litopenaei]